MTDREPSSESPGFLSDEDFVVAELPPRRRKRRLWLIGFVAAAGAVAIIGLSGCLIFSLFSKAERFTTAAEVLKSAQEITDFSLPDGYEGELAEVVDTPVFLVRKAQFRHTSGKGMLLLAEMKIKYFNDEEATRNGLEQIATEMRRVVPTQEAIEPRTIRGQSVDFRIVAGDDALSTTKYHELRGEFPGKSGQALLWLQAEDSIWDESAAHELLDSLQ